MLEVANLNAWYGSSHVLQGVDLKVGEGELVCLIGRNGAGKTTTVKSIAGLMSKVTGSVKFEGVELLGQPAHKRYLRQLAYVPEERRIVPGLTVRENIRLGLLASPHRTRESDVIDEIAETFPRLKERLDQQAVTMSGGEQQMLAIARAVASKPKMVLLDEPSEGIMPVLVDEMFEYFAALKRAGVTILLIEQNVGLALRIADRAYILDQGEVVYSGTAQAMLGDEEIQERYCSV
ncbi:MULTISPECIES: ABC transporter ATP-binding protein [Cupriavidus]|uniref:ABC transporter ATP-binding protein n=1 Tax=Cupriavidus basilensis TaxID=68895 RepID=A0A643G0Q7_9BURK|nr:MULTISPECIES: ABC transporter ATP-binding protein [Cupriavidus]KUE88007.1 ABC transporter ATP-binding protein [Cupriavidus necator]NOV23780.1 ABC transporter ATP-binding protein [Cupriavidus necator]QOT81831.1 ABC transporter ATP-binding protein [Cupriavidus basilensis]BDB30312.1 ABC transporter ATP-binding protein [Cupriavidus sp. P-10]